MVRDYEFMNVLQNIASSLRKINENLSAIRESKQSETAQYLRESRQMRRKERMMLNEGRNVGPKPERMLGESKSESKNGVNTIK